MSAEAVVVLHGRVAGQVSKTRRQGAVLRYDESHLARYDPTPLSLAFPLDRREHHVTDWLDGLLPPSLDLRQFIGRQYGAAGQHPVDLLCTPIGMDCAGAVQFYALGDGDIGRNSGADLLSEQDIEHGLLSLRRGADAWAAAMGRPLSFSLSGAQTKIALRRMPDGRWELPFGDEPSTHILKISSPGWTGNDIIEHICMSALSAVGIDAADTEIVEFGSARAICVTRFDREPGDDGRLRRVHQEDLCQAAGVPSHMRQQWAGGPSPARIARILWDETYDGDRCVRAFRDALIANWVLLAGDAHSKNYSLRLEGSDVSLCPLYDVCSEAPWKSEEERRYIQMAMKCGDSFDARDMGRQEWEACAESLRLPKRETIERAEELSEAIPKAVIDAAASLPAHLREVDVVDALHGVMTGRTATCQEVLAGGAAPSRSR
ncbi:HipA domain-containing protein [Candidatus Poriferisodalis sp.]|uniref:HipA domain-containing protein n=1 Tax=Candidatus Poriferisodalis sp. TaxID=3101277 RepID=UPI003B015A39